jgi:hypothetical protein
VASAVQLRPEPSYWILPRSSRDTQQAPTVEGLRDKPEER